MGVGQESLCKRCHHGQRREVAHVRSDLGTLCYGLATIEAKQHVCQCVGIAINKVSDASKQPT